jgi:general stress protein YciG
MTDSARGFASMNQTKRREIASRGGKAAHAKGTAHQWSREEAREAGRKGGLAQARRRTRPPAEPPAAGTERPGTIESPIGPAGT